MYLTFNFYLMVTFITDCIDKALDNSGLTVEDHLKALYCEGINTVEAQHVLRELKRTKANTKRIIQVAIDYGCIDEYSMNKKAFEAFHAFVLTVNVEDLVDYGYSSNKYQAAFTEKMEILNETY